LVPVARAGSAAPNHAGWRVITGSVEEGNGGGGLRRFERTRKPGGGSGGGGWGGGWGPEIEAPKPRHVAQAAGESSGALGAELVVAAWSATRKPTFEHSGNRANPFENGRFRVRGVIKCACGIVNGRGQESPSTVTQRCPKRRSCGKEK
jgi:hypothetical protein